MPVGNPGENELPPLQILEQIRPQCVLWRAMLLQEFCFTRPQQLTLQAIEKMATRCPEFRQAPAFPPNRRLDLGYIRSASVVQGLMELEFPGKYAGLFCGNLQAADDPPRCQGSSERSRGEMFAVVWCAIGMPILNFPRLLRISISDSSQCPAYF